MKELKNKTPNKPNKKSLNLPKVALPNLTKKAVEQDDAVRFNVAPDVGLDSKQVV